VITSSRLSRNSLEAVCTAIGQILTTHVNIRGAIFMRKAWGMAKKVRYHHISSPE
jgi:hypothetical protein